MADAGRGLDRTEAVALAYLGAPLTLWALGWFRLPVAVALLLTLAFVAAAVIRHMSAPTAEPLTRSQWALAAVVAAVWAAGTGLAGGAYLNPDWTVRLAALHDLVTMPWPVSYGSEGDGVLMLRFPMAYYLIPATVGKIAGMEEARLALYAWTAIGAAIFLALVLQSLPRRSLREIAATVAVVVLFSGMDIVGWLTTKGSFPAPGEHIEWWQWMFQYSSNATLMFWVPNHALPGWLATAVLWRHRNRGLDVSASAALLLAVAAWAPLVAAGLLPLLILGSLRGVRAAASLNAAARPEVWFAAGWIALLAAFTTFGVPVEESSRSWATARLQFALLPYLLPYLTGFAVVEWGLLALWVWRAQGRHPLIIAAMATLILLPAFRFGPGNDIVMRGGIPAMTLLMFATLEALRHRHATRLQRSAILAVLALGAVTPLLEMTRALMPASGPPPAIEGPLTAQGRPWHYVGTLQQGRLQTLLKPQASAK